MRIDLWTSNGNGNVEGEIVFQLVSGEDRQIFRRTWTVINTTRFQKEQRLECLKALIEIRLKELMKYLEKQVDQGIINVNGELKPLRDDWRIE